MKKIIVIVLFLGVFSSLLVTNVLAQEGEAGKVTFSDLGSSEPAILVGNPFYRLKSLRWGVKKLFSNDFGLKKAILNEKAAEVKKVFSLNSRDESLSLKVLLEYQKIVMLYRLELANILKKGTLEDNRDVFAQILAHIRLFDEIEGTYLVNDAKVVLFDIQEQLVQSFELLVSKAIGLKNLDGVLNDLIGEDVIENVRYWEVLDSVYGFLDDEGLLSFMILNYSQDLQEKIKAEISFLDDEDRLGLENVLVDLVGTGRWVSSE